MIKDKKIYNFLKICEIFYETEEVVLNAISLRPFSMVRIYSYVPLKLPGNFKLLSEKKTTRIVLYDKSADEIALSFRKNYRNEIRKTYRDDRVLAKIEEGFSKDGYALYREFEIQAHRPYLTEGKIGGVWSLGYINGELVSGIYLIDTFPVLKIASIFSVRKQANVQNATLIGCVGKRLMYDICLWAKKGHYEYVDLAFFDENDETKAGIAKYKLGFGGDVVNEYMYEKKTVTIDFLKFIRRKVGI